jgi:hypothetical protein
MSNSKLIPQPPATLPDGTLDCDPDPMSEVFSDLERWEKMPPEELHLERLRDEELKHARALAEIRAQAPSRRKKPASTESSRREEIQKLIARAAQEAGRNNRQFCEFLDRDHVPVPPAWGVRSWPDAWGKSKLHAQIRSFKRRYKSLS